MPGRLGTTAFSSSHEITTYTLIFGNDFVLYTVYSRSIGLPRGLRIRPHVVATIEWSSMCVQACKIHIRGLGSGVVHHLSLLRQTRNLLVVLVYGCVRWFHIILCELLYFSMYSGCLNVYVDGINGHFSFPANLCMKQATGPYQPLDIFNILRSGTK